MTNSPIRCEAAPIDGSKLWMRANIACGELREVSAAADGDVRRERLDVAMSSLTGETRVWVQRYPNRKVCEG